ncbi:hypothetical protein R1flu_027058 [Riccia fluitans]|uniref:Uncharacterized protein n=1 Tax=Riccia fluitans TaxID=41844 RepID=A0ABD1XI78_9MARC
MFALGTPWVVRLVSLSASSVATPKKALPCSSRGASELPLLASGDAGPNLFCRFISSGRLSGVLSLCQLASGAAGFLFPRPTVTSSSTSLEDKIPAATVSKREEEVITIYEQYWRERAGGGEIGLFCRAFRGGVVEGSGFTFSPSISSESGRVSNSGKMAMAVASCTGSLSSLCMSAGPRSTNNAVRRSLFLEAFRLTTFSRERSSTPVSVNGCTQTRFSVVGLAGQGSERGNGDVQVFEALRSKGESRDRSFRMGASASSSASSAPGISHAEPLLDAGDGGNGFSGGRRGGGGGGGGDDGHGGAESSGAGHGGSIGGGVFSAFLNGWRSRVQADPQFPFKVLTEEVIGVGACVLGDMATRPNFGLNELDLVFSTIVVGSILNFTLMYMLAPTSAIGPLVQKLPGIFANCPTGHMFEVGHYSLLDRFGTFVYKGGQFAVVGFIAGLVGTFTSTTLLNARKKMDPDFVIQNTPPPTLLNAATWALHMGISSNSRYQTINGLEFAMAKFLPPAVFKTVVFLVRGLNNVLGGTSFVILARLTGSQPKEGTSSTKQIAEGDTVLQHEKTS